jgi:hypothetical protein
MNDEQCFVSGCSNPAVDTVPNPLDESLHPVAGMRASSQAAQNAPLVARTIV